MPVLYIRLAVEQAVFDPGGGIHRPNPAEYLSLDRLCWFPVLAAAPRR
jgi:hypothetical protein